MPKNAWIFLLATVLGALLMSYLWVSTERRNQLAALEKKSNFVLPASISPYKKVESIRHRGTSYIPTPSESLKSSFKLVRWVNDQKVMSLVDGTTSGWNVDLELGWGQSVADVPLYRCKAKTKQSVEHFFISRQSHCYREEFIEPETKLALSVVAQSPQDFGLMLCLTPSNNYYLSLNEFCESHEDKVLELVGFIAPIQILKDVSP